MSTSWRNHIENDADISQEGIAYIKEEVNKLIQEDSTVVEIAFFIEENLIYLILFFVAVVLIQLLGLVKIEPLLFFVGATIFSILIYMGAIIIIAKFNAKIHKIIAQARDNYSIKQEEDATDISTESKLG